MRQEKKGGWAPALRWLKSHLGLAQANRSGDDGLPVGPVVRLPDTLVRLQGHEDLYVEASFDLEVSVEDDKEAVKAQLLRIHDATIEVLSKLGPEQLRGSRQLEKTKTRLLARLRREVPGQSLRAVYVSRLVFGGV
ncbi:MAG: flagellar basal body-associated FliL family protein [Deltaproteobacteria bacterium]|nr:flagellar basal body-associated FliL family protein [Deltaproteobacteria bacterium]